MKKTLLTLALVAGFSAAAFAQGSTQFSNGTLFRLSTSNLDGTGTAVISTTPGQFEFGLFYGIGSSANMTLLSTQFGVNSTTGAGLIAGTADGKTSVNLVTIPGTSPSESDVFIQILGWSAAYGTDWQAAQAAFNAGTAGVGFKASNIANIASLGATTGPGAAIWAAATSTSTSLVHAFVIPINPVPEPTSLALLGLGAAGMMIFRRRK